MARNCLENWKLLSLKKLQKNNNDKEYFLRFQYQTKDLLYSYSNKFLFYHNFDQITSLFLKISGSCIWSIFIDTKMHAKFRQGLEIRPRFLFFGSFRKMFVYTQDDKRISLYFVLVLQIEQAAASEMSQ